LRAACLALLLAGCVQTLSFIESGVPSTRHPNVTPAQVRLYHPDDPLPPFTEIGYLEVDELTSDGSLDEEMWVQSELAREAAANGCNAVVVHDPCARISNDSQGGQVMPRVAATCLWVGDP